MIWNDRHASEKRAPLRGLDRWRKIIWPLLWLECEWLWLYQMSKRSLVHGTFLPSSWAGLRWMWNERVRACWWDSWRKLKSARGCRCKVGRRQRCSDSGRSISRTHADQFLCSKPLLPIWLFLSLSFCTESDSLSLSCSCRTRSSSVSMIFRSSSSWRSPSSSSSSLELLMSLKISLSSSRWASHQKKKKSLGVIKDDEDERWTWIMRISPLTFWATASLWMQSLDRLPEDPWPILWPEVPGEESRLAKEPCWSPSFDSSSLMISHPECFGLKWSAGTPLCFYNLRIDWRMSRAHSSRTCLLLHSNATAIIRI